jgi:hypothetical protein
MRADNFPVSGWEPCRTFTIVGWCGHAKEWA